MSPLPPKVLRRILLVAGILAVGAAFAAAYTSGLLPGPGKEDRVRDTEVAKQDTKIKVAANTDFTQKITYLKCGDEETFHTKPADNLIGLTAAQIQKVYAGWTMEKFDTKEVVLSLKVDSYCREHANNMFIGVKDGYVAVYSGRPGPRAIIREVTKIPVRNLSADDIEELKRGMVVKSREELLRTLEGMHAQ
ncbi:BofC C-terminal domain-containing protein [Anaeroselena agilis]|uniref:BofC C-terminal domain-containing protein n=1 Tax=Anaeroselena agilis TaxID=3063788 RepID=A0ABU3NW04_9FIRM|nr:BofC C-terminal domain-containing protein [Selenomonadales bacterium 4137-cl]